jgi:hypothetical protein
MSELVHADIFFFVTTIVVVAVGITLTVALIYIIGILRDVQEIIRTAKAATEDIKGSISHLTSMARHEGLLARTLGRYAMRSVYYVFSRLRKRATGSTSKQRPDQRDKGDFWKSDSDAGPSTSGQRNGR